MSLSLRQQRTICRPVSMEGCGYWSARDVHVEFRPAGCDTGIVFVRRDLDPVQRIPAHVSHRIDVPRRTTLASGSGTVEMVEHIMAALAGLQIDNCEVWVDAAEMPGHDGSSQTAVEVLARAGAEAQPAWRRKVSATESIRVGNAEQWLEVHPLATDDLIIEYNLDYGAHNGVGRQTLEIAISPDDFCRELAPARTFILEADANWLRSQGLGRKTTYQDLLVFNDQGPIGNPLRFPDECVRHKILDLVGDLALAGCDIRGRIVAHRSGHRLNADLVRAILSQHPLEIGRKKSA